MNARLVAGLLLPFLCIWDSDTLDDELLGLPEAEALVVTGRWVRHGKPHYERRVREIPSILALDPANYDLYDDLAVAYDRLGDSTKALEVLERKAALLEKRPDAGHRYRLLANRGMFLARAGRYEDAVADLEKAVGMNPDSHFGREKYQIALFRFLADSVKDPSLPGRANFLSHLRIDPEGGWRCVVRSTLFADGVTPEPGERREIPWKDAFTAVAGMFRAGSTGEAELYRTLGDLFLAGRVGDLHLAWWSYRRAMALGHPSCAGISRTVESIEKHWEDAALFSLPTEKTFREMLESESKWLSALHAAEGSALGGPSKLPQLDGAATSQVGRAPQATQFHFGRFLHSQWGMVAIVLAGALGLTGGAIAKYLRDRRVGLVA